MVLLPNHLGSELDIFKLRDYCLSESHPCGRHKARLFASALGISARDAGWLKSHLLEGLAHNEAVMQERDAFGQRWRVDMPLTRQNQRCVVRTIWIVRSGSAVPHFVTCWVL